MPPPTGMGRFDTSPAMTEVNAQESEKPVTNTCAPQHL
jgi:hypothetical protein